MTEQVSKVGKKSFGILGCGWLGYPLAQRLKTLPITSLVKGSTTSPAKINLFEAQGIQGYLIDLGKETDLAQALDSPFFEVDTLIISLPPRTKVYGDGHYPLQVSAIANAIRKSQIREVVFISSTSVYPDLNRAVTEKDVIEAAQSASQDIVTAEKLMEDLRADKTVTILRLGGLLGYNRIPGKYVRGQKNLTTGDLPVNYIHRDDAVEIISAMLVQGIKSGTYNVVAPLHPSRRAVYDLCCAQFGWEAPTYDSPEKTPAFKIVLAEKLSRDFDFSYKFPDPLGFHYTLEEQ
ncbi:NAD(P)H-binding protein [Dyadobacter sandarakinus]|uniref:NAD(P)H-binding protein n=1 Tax=Dyadobacter sandarakinus TaxID=2747268 RepID=A0ABX7IC54_9BACT|nr:NAD(P)H-binding protein [Dyadobacter sandarakinus]QRR03042.1 NAD(P)H-binding protein [Dyadobacter sandarakinus]